MAADRTATRRVLLHTLLGLLAGLVLLGSGLAHLPGTATATTSPVSTTAGGTTQEAVHSGGGELVLRAGGLAALAAPASPGAGLLPGARRDIAPHLVAEPQSRPPTGPPAAARVRAAGSRAPPGTAGT